MPHNAASIVGMGETLTERCFNDRGYNDLCRGGNTPHRLGAIPVLRHWFAGTCDFRLGSRVGGALAKNFLTFCSIGRVRSRVRPVDAARMYGAYRRSFGDEPA